MGNRGSRSRSGCRARSSDGGGPAGEPPRPSASPNEPSRAGLTGRSLHEDAISSGWPTSSVSCPRSPRRTNAPGGLGRPSGLGNSLPLSIPLSGSRTFFERPRRLRLARITRQKIPRRGPQVRFLPGALRPVCGFSKPRSSSCHSRAEHGSLLRDQFRPHDLQCQSGCRRPKGRLLLFRCSLDSSREVGEWNGLKAPPLEQDRAEERA